MAARKSKGSLETKLKKLQKQDGGTIKIESIAEIVDETDSSAISAVLEKEHNLVHELELLREYIDDAKAEISSLRPDEVKTQHLPNASGEPDAIVKATEVATNEIMNATEVVGQIADTIGGDQGSAIFDATMRIYEACGFQDITGQRITKIISTLQHIEDKVDALAVAFGDGSAKKVKKSPKKPLKKSAKKSTKPSAKKPAKKVAKKAAKKSPGKKIDDTKAIADADLLDGPQLPGDAIRQDEVDALLSSFD